MTDSTPETQPDPQPEQQPASPTPDSSTACCSRSPVERAIVWGTIAVLVVIAVLEARARFGFKVAYDSLLDRLQQGEKTGKLLSGLEVTDILKGRKPDESHKVRGLVNTAVRVDIYRFGGILQKRTLYVYYGSGGTKGQPEVVAVSDREGEKYVPPAMPSPGAGSGTVEPAGHAPAAGQPSDGKTTGLPVKNGDATKTPATKTPATKTPATKTPKSAPAKSKPKPPMKKSSAKKAPAAKSSKSAPAKPKSKSPTKKKQ